MVFSVVMYGCELDCKEVWVLIDAFELWCWRRLLRVPWTARSNQWILKEINPEYSLERLILKLKLQCFWPPDVKSRLTGKDSDAGKYWGQGEKEAPEEEKGGASLTQRTWVWANSRRYWRTGKLVVLHFMGLQRVRHNLATEQLNGWLLIICIYLELLLNFVLSLNTHIHSRVLLILSRNSKISFSFLLLGDII